MLICTHQDTSILIFDWMFCLSKLFCKLLCYVIKLFHVPLAAASSASWAIPLICSDVSLYFSLYFSVCFSILFLCFLLCCPFSEVTIALTFLFPLLYLPLCLYGNPFLLTRHSLTNHFFASIVNCPLYILPMRIDVHSLIVIVQLL